MVGIRSRVWSAVQLLIRVRAASAAWRKSTVRIPAPYSLASTERNARPQVVPPSPNSWLAVARAIRSGVPSARDTGPARPSIARVSAAIPPLYVANESMWRTSSICDRVLPAAPFTVIASATAMEYGESARLRSAGPRSPHRSSVRAPMAVTTPGTARAFPALRSTSALTRRRPAGAVAEPLESLPQAERTGAASPAAPRIRRESRRVSMTIGRPARRSGSGRSRSVEDQRQSPVTVRRPPAAAVAVVGAGQEPVGAVAAGRARHLVREMGAGLHHGVPHDGLPSGGSVLPNRRR